MRPLASVLAATLLLAAGAGCSGDEPREAASATTAPPETAAATTAGAETRPEPPSDQSRWAAQVDAACGPVQRRIDSLAQPADAAGLERWVSDVLPLLREEIEAVSAVKPPAKEEEARRAAAFVESLRDLAAALTRYRDALGARDAAAVELALVDVNEAGSRARAGAVSLDVTGCGGYSQ